MVFKLKKIKIHVKPRTRVEGGENMKILTRLDIGNNEELESYYMAYLKAKRSLIDYLYTEDMN